MSLYGGGSAGSPFAASPSPSPHSHPSSLAPLRESDGRTEEPTRTSSATGDKDAATASPTPLSPHEGRHHQQQQLHHHPLSCPPTATTFSPLTSPNGTNSTSTGTPGSSEGGTRRSLLGGRSAQHHARRQSTISYIRSPSPAVSVGGPASSPGPLAAYSASSPHYNSNGSAPSTPRNSFQERRTGLIGGAPALNGSVEEAGAGDSAAAASSSSSSTILDPSSTSTAMSVSVSQQSAASSASHTSPYNEMNVGIGARSADLLSFIAKKERKCMELREGESRRRPICGLC